MRKKDNYESKEKLKRIRDLI